MRLKLRQVYIQNQPHQQAILQSAKETNVRRRHHSMLWTLTVKRADISLKKAFLLEGGVPRVHEIDENAGLPLNIHFEIP